MNFFSQDSQLAKKCLSTIIKIAEENTSCIYPRKGDDDAWVRMCYRLEDSSALSLAHRFFDCDIELNDPRYNEVYEFLCIVPRFKYPEIRHQISPAGQKLIVAELKAAFESFKLMSAEQVKLI